MKYKNKIFFMCKEINKRIDFNLSLIREYNDQLMKENKTKKEIDLIQKSITLIEREQSFLIDLLQKAKEIDN
tara:strand:+ start:246 stop:461 length:216 start_codon:yes stop_codon:yes gene_type:complete